MNWDYCGMSISAGVMATAKTDFLFKNIKSIVSKTNKIFWTSFVYKCGVWTERELFVRRVLNVNHVQLTNGVDPYRCQHTILLIYVCIEHLFLLRVGIYCEYNIR